MIGFYTMNWEGVVRAATEAKAQEQELDDDRCRVAFHEAANGKIISTVFLPICLMFEDGSPQCFETVIVWNCKSKVVKRYSTFEAAIYGHDGFVTLACLSEQEGIV